MTYTNTSYTNTNGYSSTMYNPVLNQLNRPSNVENMAPNAKTTNSKPLPTLPTRGPQKLPPVNEDISRSAQDQLTYTSSQEPASQVLVDVNISPIPKEPKTQTIWRNSRGSNQEKDRPSSLQPTMFCRLGQENVFPPFQKGDRINTNNHISKPSNPIDNYGSPLHEAAAHGDYESAAILLQNGAKVDLVNENGDLPFDLAIRHGNDDFIHFFLQISRRLPKQDIIDKDVEGHHYKLLMTAKEKGLVEEQIFHLQVISDHYIEKKKDFLTGAKLLNAALALLYQLPSFEYFTIFEQYLFARLEQIVTMFIESKGLKRPINQTYIVSCRNRLKEIRQAARIDLEEYQKVQQPNRKGAAWEWSLALKKERIIQKTLAGLTIGFKALLRDLIREAMKMVGPSPVDWDCMGMGSMSRDEMFPRSDLEFAFVIEKETEEAMGYFRTVAQILEFLIINLGETKFPIFGDNYPSPTPGGFCMDSAGNTPLGVEGVYELIGTPETLLQFQETKWMDRNIVLPNALNNVCLVAGRGLLRNKYLMAKKYKVSQYKILAERLLTGHLKEYAPKFSEENEAVGIKQQLYRPFQEILGSIYYLYQSSIDTGSLSQTTFNRINTLRITSKVFSEEGAKYLQKAVSQVFALRLKAHLFYEDEMEILCHPKIGEPLDPHLLYFDEDSLKALREIYQVLKPFHECAKQFITSQSKKTFKKSKFYEEIEFSKYSSSNEVKQAIALNPNDVVALEKLAAEESRMGNHKEALHRYLKALEISIEKYGEKHPEVVRGCMQVAGIYRKLGDHAKAGEYCQKELNSRLQLYDESQFEGGKNCYEIAKIYGGFGDNQNALKYRQNALKICLQTLDEGSPKDYTLAAIQNSPEFRYRFIAKICEDLGNYEDALKYLFEVLNIKLQTKNTGRFYASSIASCYIEIGNLHNAFKHYKEALEIHQMALNIQLQDPYKEPTRLISSYQAIVRDYRNLGEYEKVFECHQKILDIKLKTLEENHPDIGQSYSNIAGDYRDLGNYEKALEYDKKALKIREQGANLPFIANSYSNIAEDYRNLGDYAKALENDERALKIREQGANPQLIANSCNNIAKDYRNLGDYKKEHEYHQKALNVGSQDTKEKNPQLTKNITNIGNDDSTRRGSKKTLEYHLEVLNIKLPILGEKDPYIATCYNEIGDDYSNLGEYKEALEYHQKALNIRLLVLEENHPNIALCYKNIGEDYRKLGDNEKALDNFKMAVEIFCRAHKQSHPNILDVLKSLIVVAEKLQSSQLESLKPTYALCVRTLGGEDGLNKKFLQLIR